MKTVERFPDIDGHDFLGKTRRQTGLPEWLLNILELKWRSEGVVYKGKYIDYSDLSYLKEHFFDLSGDGAVLSRNKSAQAGREVVRSGRLYFFSDYRSKRTINVTIVDKSPIIVSYTGLRPLLRKYCETKYGLGTLVGLVYYVAQPVRNSQGVQLYLSVGMKDPGIDNLKGILVVNDGIIRQINSQRWIDSS
jgi:hypothetical protein